MKNKTPLIIGGIVLLLIVLVGGIFAFRGMSGSSETTTETEEPVKKRRAESLNEIPVQERPFVTIAPDGTRNVTITVENVKKDATSMEYELEYQAGSLLQGAFGGFELASLPITEDVLLGSCSAGGSCTYHEDVKGGTMLLRFEGGEARYALKQDWKYIQASGETAVSSKDAKFQIEAPGLARSSVVIVYNTPGYPEGLEGTPVSEPYSLQTSSALSGEAELTMRAMEEGDLTIMGWNGSEWTSFETESDGKTATATGELMELYIVVQN